MKIIPLLLLTMALGTNAYAIDVYRNGKHLGAECANSASAFDQGKCLGFILGVADTMEWTVSLGAVTKTYCAPEEARGAQVTKVVVKYLDSHPEQLHLAAASLVVVAFEDAFPCQQE